MEAGPRTTDEDRATKAAELLQWPDHIAFRQLSDPIEIGLAHLAGVCFTQEIESTGHIVLGQE